MKKAILITQSKEWALNRLIELKIYNHANTHDFLSTCKGEYYGETEYYLFKYVNVALFKEVRIFKRSKRVTTSIYRTKLKQTT